MQDASDETPSGMVSVLGLDRERVEQLCDDVRQEGEVLRLTLIYGLLIVALTGVLTVGLMALP